MTTTTHTEREVSAAADRITELLDELNVDTVKVDNTDDLRAIAKAFDELRAAEAALIEAVAMARAHGRSWNRIAVPLGVTRQAARQRFAEDESAEPRRGVANRAATKRATPAKRGAPTKAAAKQANHGVRTATKAAARRRAAG